MWLVMNMAITARSGMLERRRFGRGAQRHDVVHAAFDHIVDHACQRLVVDFSFGVKGVIMAAPTPQSLCRII